MKKLVKHISFSAMLAMILCFFIGSVSFAAPKAFYYPIGADGKESNNAQFIYLTDRTRLNDGIGLVWGKGKLPDYESKVVRPWAGDTSAMGIYKLEIDDLNREGRITGIGDHFFEGMYNLWHVTMYPYVKTISKTAFKDCDKLTTIDFKGTRSQWETIMYNSAMNLRKDLPGVSVKCTDGSVLPVSVNADCFVNITQSSYSYTGKQICPKVHVFYKSKELVENKDFVVSYGPNKDDDKGYVRVDGKGSFYGTKTVYFKITKITKTVKLSASNDLVRVGEKVKISADVPAGNLYKLRVSNGSVAEAQGTTAVKGLKCGVVTVKAIPVNKNKCEIKSNSIQITVVPAAPKNFTTYTKQSTGYITLKWDPVPSADGYYIYRDNKKIKTIKNYKTSTYTDKKATKNGHRYVYVVISYSKSYGFLMDKSVSAYYLTKQKIKKLKEIAGHKVQVKYTKNMSASGYEIQYSYDKFKKDIGYKEVKIKSQGIVNLPRILGKGRTIYVRVRSYYIPKTNPGKIFYSAWSPIKKYKRTK